MESRLITASDLFVGGLCYEGVMQSASPDWPTAFPVSVVLAEAEKRGEVKQVEEALELRGYGDGDGDGDGDGNGDGDGYGNGDGDGDGDGYGYGYGYGNGNGDGNG